MSIHLCMLYTTWCQTGTMPPNQLASLKAPNTLILTNNTSSNWKVWILAYNIYATVTGITGRTESMQCCIFLHVMGEEVQRLHASMTCTATEQDKIDLLVCAYRDNCMEKANIKIMHFHFNTHNQGMKTMKAYITALKDCN